MRSRYRITIGGVHLDSLDDSLLILDIGNTSPDRSIKKTTIANLDGYDITDTYVGQQTVTVSFEIHEYSVSKRNEICQKVNAWAAGGGTLYINDRPNQRLYNVVCEQYASIESARNWTDPLTLVFATTRNPYWRSSTTVAKTLVGKNAKGNFVLDGNVSYSPISVTVTAAAKVTSLQLTAGSSTLKLTGLDVAKDQQIVVDYVSTRYLRIRANGKSVMTKLDPSSSDRLLANCGETTEISVSSNAKVTAQFTGRGCWL